MVGPYPFGSVQRTIWLPDPGPVLPVSLSITHSVRPTLAVWVQPTSCWGDICLCPHSGGTDVCAVEKILEASLHSVFPVTPSAEET